MNVPKKKIPTRGKTTIYTKIINILKRFEYWGFIIGLIVGLIPYFITVTPINNIIHPITINPSTISNPYPYNAIGYFNVTNNRNTTLYAVQIQIDIPQGLTSEDIEVNKLTRTENIVVEIPGEKGSVMWDTSIMLIGGYKDSHQFIIMQLDRVLPGESNIISFSIQVKATKVTEPIKLSCVSYSKQP